MRQEYLAYVGRSVVEHAIYKGGRLTTLPGYYLDALAAHLTARRKDSKRRRDAVMANPEARTAEATRQRASRRNRTPRARSH